MAFDFYNVYLLKIFLDMDTNNYLDYVNYLADMAELEEEILKQEFYCE